MAELAPLPSSHVPAKPVATPDASRAAVERAAKEFEGLVLAQLLAPMFEGSNDPDGMFGGGAGEKMFRPMLIEHYAKGVAEAGGIGLAEAVTREMLALQAQPTEGQDGAAR